MPVLGGSGGPTCHHWLPSGGSLSGAASGTVGAAARALSRSASTAARLAGWMAMLTLVVLGLNLYAPASPLSNCGYFASQQSSWSGSCRLPAGFDLEGAVCALPPANAVSRALGFGAPVFLRSQRSRENYISGRWGSVHRRALMLALAGMVSIYAGYIVATRLLSARKPPVSNVDRTTNRYGCRVGDRQCDRLRTQLAQRYSASISLR